MSSSKDPYRFVFAEPGDLSAFMRKELTEEERQARNVKARDKARAKKKTKEDRAKGHFAMMNQSMRAA